MALEPQVCDGELAFILSPSAISMPRIDNCTIALVVVVVLFWIFFQLFSLFLCNKPSSSDTGKVKIIPVPGS